MEKKITALLKKRSMTLAELAFRVDLTPLETAEYMQTMVEEGKVRLRKNGCYVLADQGLVTGPLSVKRSGFAFVLAEDGDVYVRKEDFAGAFPNETVTVRLLDRGSQHMHREGVVVDIPGPLPEIVGEIYVNRSRAYLRPDDPMIEDVLLVKTGKALHAGEKAIVRITRRAQKGMPPEGELKESLGAANAPGVDILSVARSFGHETVFSDDVLSEGDRMAALDPSLELEGREVLFDKLICTIDGADSKDLDDAISLETLENGNSLLGVHIADVSHYVRQGSILDKEACKRGTSVYLIDQVIPMLPPALSNGICSLHPHVVRLTLSCFVELDPAGEPVSHRIARTAIRSSYRMTYEDVNRILAGDGDLADKYGELTPVLFSMNQLAEKLRVNRFRNGGMDFDLPEPEILLDERGRTKDVVMRERGPAEKLIEEFMILANNSVAEEYFYRQVPFVYRIHERPDGDRIRELSVFLKNHGLHLKGSQNVHSRALQQVLDECRGMEGENVVQKMMLRSLKKARYSTDNSGHFGLGSMAYCHFTSPIRRYPDLMDHRVIKSNLDSQVTGEEWEALMAFLTEAAQHASQRERNAIDTERAVDERKMAQFMEDKIGEEFRGIISGVTSAAIFVQLPNTIEGVLPLASLHDDYYEWVKDQYCVIGRRRRKKLALGDPLIVRVEDADARTSRIEFSLVKKIYQ